MVFLYRGLFENQSSFKNVNILFENILFALFSVTQAVELTARDFAKYDEKLRSYQNLTGINESAFKEIWDAGISNRKFLMTLRNTINPTLY